MAPVPYTPNGRMTILYTVSGFVHKLRVPVDLVLPYVVPGNLQLVNPVGGTVGAGPAAQHLWDTARAFYSAATNPASYLVEENFSGTFIPLESGALTGSGTNGGANLLASEFTGTFKDSANHKFKFILLEQTLAAPQSLSYPTGQAPIDNLVGELLSATSSTELGNWVRSRGDFLLVRSAKNTFTFNKRLRRSRHLI